MKCWLQLIYNFWTTLLKSVFAFFKFSFLEENVVHNSNWVNLLKDWFNN